MMPECRIHAQHAQWACAEKVRDAALDDEKYTVRSIRAGCVHCEPERNTPK